MAEPQEVLKYFGNYCKFTNLPSYEDFLQNLVERRQIQIETLGRHKPITQLEIKASEFEQKLADVKRIASYLWGGRDSNPEIMTQLEIVSIERIDYADKKPLRFNVQFPGKVRRFFFAKPFNSEDVGRIFGLELEHLLSPYKFDYSVGGQAIYEDGIEGMEARDFLFASGIKTASDPAFLEELVRLDYRCQTMLVGDMHSYNYLVTAIRDANGSSFKIRAIDFDQLFSVRYDINRRDLDTSVFREPQVPKKEAIKILGKERYNSIVSLERECMRKRFIESQSRICDLTKIIGYSEHCNKDFEKLAKQLALFHKDNAFLDESKVSNAGELLRLHLQRELLDKD